MTNPKDKQVGGEHYKKMSIQPSEFIVKNNLGWYEGNAVKYICRHQAKGGRQDLEKAIHYLELALQQYYPDPVIQEQQFQGTDIIESGMPLYKFLVGEK